MKSRLGLILVAFVATTTFAQDLPENAMGMFFSDTEFNEETTNANGSPGYVVVANPTMDSIGGYEVGIDIDPPLLVTEIFGPNGWVNFGSNTNHIVGYEIPLPASDFVVLCAMTFFVADVDTHLIRMGPTMPGGVGPMIADGENPSDIYVANLTTCYPEDSPMYRVVATVNGDGVELCWVVATHETSWSNVKGLFE